MSLQDAYSARIMQMHQVVMSISTWDGNKLHVSELDNEFS